MKTGIFAIVLALLCPVVAGFGLPEDGEDESSILTSLAKVAKSAADFAGDQLPEEVTDVAQEIPGAVAGVVPDNVDEAFHKDDDASIRGIASRQVEGVAGDIEEKDLENAAGDVVQEVKPVLSTAYEVPGAVAGVVAENANDAISEASNVVTTENAETGAALALRGAQELGIADDNVTVEDVRSALVDDNVTVSDIAQEVGNFAKDLHPLQSLGDALWYAEQALLTAVDIITHFSDFLLELLSELWGLLSGLSLGMLGLVAGLVVGIFWYVVISVYRSGVLATLPI